MRTAGLVRCPSWVKSGPWRVLERCPLYPDEQTSASARANGTKLGRHRVDPAVEARILELKASGDGILKIGRKLGIGTSVVQRLLKQEPQLIRCVAAPSILKPRPLVRSGPAEPSTSKQEPRESLRWLGGSALSRPQSLPAHRDARK